MAKRFIPALNRVLVEKIVPPSKTSAGILLPEKTSKELADQQAEITSFYKISLNAAKVIAVGPGDRDKNGNVIPVSFKEGEEVLLPEYGGTEVKLGEKVYHLFRDDDILGVLQD